MDERRGKGCGRDRCWDDERSVERMQKIVCSGDEVLDEKFEWDGFSFEKWDCEIFVVDSDSHGLKIVK